MCKFCGRSWGMSKSNLLAWWVLLNYNVYGCFNNGDFTNNYARRTLGNSPQVGSYKTKFRLGNFFFFFREINLYKEK